ncbi:MAG: hypothetical protein LBS11_05845 [Oscillospiraceae bacterium]|jgi:L-ascorbate metabolism protein UlaG (beta-lactamase superfamily)|nr:hypothetical protein [Oscillospiraceae bacterium]
MEQNIRVTYLEHSAFAVYGGRTALVFDYARPDPDDPGLPAAPGLPFPGGYVTPDALDAFERVYAFASHSHGDHYSRGIFKWMGHKSVSYILGYDITDAPAGHRLSPGETRAFPELTVTARASTDLGVSFMVDWHEAGLVVFHAGDLNLWHWRDESTPREIERAEQAFYAAMGPIYGSRVDMAFFPVDPRQGAMYDAGAAHFISRIQPSLFFPTHFWGRADVAMDFARRNAERRTLVVPLTKPGETIEAARDTGGAPRARNV